MTDAKVFIIHRTTVPHGDQGQRIDRHDLSSAARHGKLVNIFADDEARQDSDAIVKRLKTALKDFSDQDAILCTGDPLILLAAGMVLQSDCLNWSNMRILKWDKYRKDYIPYYIYRVLPT